MLPSVLSRLLAKFAMIAPGGYTLRPWLHRMRGVKIGQNAWISQFVYIDEAHPEAIEIGNNVTIGLRSTLFAHMYSGKYEPGKKVGKIVIEDNAYIGPHCVLFLDVTVGEGSVVAGGSVVTKNVPPGVLFGPPPPEPMAKVTRPLVKGKDMDYKKFLLGLRKL